MAGTELPARAGAPLQWHLFGRGDGGYATLARSKDLPLELATALERFQWGEASRPEYGRTLDQCPAFLLEMLWDRVAFTRVLAGDLDDAGRETLRFVTLILEPDRFRRLGAAGSLALLHSSGIWEDPGTARLPDDGARQLTARRPVVDRLVQLVGLSVERRTSVVAPLEAASPEEVLVAVHELSARGGRIPSVAYRALVDSLPCDLVLFDSAGMAMPSNSRRMFVDQALAASAASAPRSEVGPPRQARLAVTRSVTTSRGERTPGSPILELPESLEMSSRVALAFIGLALVVIVLGLANLISLSRNDQALRKALAAELEENRATILEELRKAERGRLGEESSRAARVAGIERRLEALGVELAELARVAAQASTRIDALAERVVAGPTAAGPAGELPPKEAAKTDPASESPIRENPQ